MSDTLRPMPGDRFYAFGCAERGQVEAFLVAVTESGGPTRYLVRSPGGNTWWLTAVVHDTGVRWVGMLFEWNETAADER